MIIEKRKSIAKSIILLSFSLFLYLLSYVEIIGVDKQAKEYYDSSLKKAVVAYASIRGINAIVSVIKESDLELAPTGLGISLAVGQVLDPIDDMVERVSDVLVVAIVSLGVERIVMEVGTSVSLKLASLLLIPIIILIWFPNKYRENVTTFLSKLIVFLLILRFFIPMSSYVNTYINTNFLDKEIEASQKKLDVITYSDNLGDFGTVESSSGGILGQLSGAIKAVKIKTLQLEEAFVRIKNNSKDLIKAMISITTVYIIGFIIQVLIIPIGTFYGLFKLSGVFLRESGGKYN